MGEFSLSQINTLVKTSRGKSEKINVYQKMFSPLVFYHFGIVVYRYFLDPQCVIIPQPELQFSVSFSTFSIKELNINL